MNPTVHYDTKVIIVFEHEYKKIPYFLLLAVNATRDWKRRKLAFWTSKEPQFEFYYLDPIKPCLQIKELWRTHSWVSGEYLANKISQ